MNPFEALGLAPTADRAAIRRAYAQGVRLHRPDDDPAGFRAVRDAYELLSRMPDDELAALVADATAPADRGTTPTGPAADPAVAATSDAPTTVPEPGARDEADGVVLPATWTEALHAARARSPGAARDEAVVAALEAAARDADADPTLWLAWQRAVAASIEGRGDLLVELVPAERAVALLRHAPTDLPSALPQGLVATRRWGRLRTLAATVLAAAPTLDQPVVVFTYRALAFAIAVLDPTTARALADRAFALAPPAGRAELVLGAVDALARVGDEWADRGGEARILLTSVAAGVYDPASPQGGEDEVVARTVRLGGDSATAQLLRELAPSLFERAAATANAAAEASASEVAERTRRVERKAVTVTSPSGRLGSVPWYLIMALVLILNLAGRCQTRTPAPTYTPPPRFSAPVKVRFDPAQTEAERLRRMWNDPRVRVQPPSPAPSTPAMGDGR